MQRSQNLRPLKSLPVYIEEDHHEVLPHIFKHIGAKNLPLEHNTLIHFDSHPDLLLPADLSPQDAFDKFKLFQKLSIENWILPGVFVGVLKTIIWVCPWWSQQIQPGEYSFEVGKTKDNKLAVTCLEAYYISEGLFTSRDNLEDTKEVNLIVIKLDENDENMRGLRDQLLSVEQQIAEVGHYILDFDLDFFSTLNPFISLYSEAGLYQKLRDLYSIGPVPHNLETPAKIEMAMKSTKDRTELLEKLKNIFEFLSTDENLSMYEGPGEELTGVVSDIVLSVRKHYPREEVDWRLVHDAGCTFDDSELPHHISSPAQILSLLRMTETLLDLLGQPPTIVTMSRSSQDDYCPPHQVEEIQAGLLNLLKIKFGNIAEHHCYQQDFQIRAKFAATAILMGDSCKMETMSSPSSKTNFSDSIDICHTKVPKSVLLQIFQYFDRETLRAASEVSKTFNELSKHPALWKNAVYSGPHSQLPQLQKAIPFPPPAVLQTTLPAETRVIPAPKFSTILPPSTKILLPVLPETVPLIAQVPDVVATTQEARKPENKECAGKEVVEISQVLPGYARSYAGDYVPNEVNRHSFSTFANTISFNVSRYPTPVESTDSKDYSQPDQEAGERGEEAGDRDRDSAVRGVEELELTGGGQLSRAEYVPAEYFRGVPTAQLIQSVVISKSVTNVKPEVLASGRILTHMTPIPSPLTVTMSTTSDTIVSSLENGHSHREHQNGHGNGAVTDN